MLEYYNFTQSNVFLSKCKRYSSNNINADKRHRYLNSQMRFCVGVFICLSKSSTVFTVPSKTYIKNIHATTTLTSLHHTVLPMPFITKTSPC